MSTYAKYGLLHRKGYLGNKMNGVPYFNAPWFDGAAMVLRDLGYDMFNPAEQDRELGLDPMKCPKGSREEAVALGFNYEAALLADYTWIAQRSRFLVVGPQWRDSPGTVSEIAVHQALNRPVFEYEPFVKWHYTKHPYKITDLALPPLLQLGTLEPETEEEDDGITCDC